MHSPEDQSGPDTGKPSLPMTSLSSYLPPPPPTFLPLVSTQFYGSFWLKLFPFLFSTVMKWSQGLA
ncbi:hypothetical protein ACRRTK_008637 [Alexandromys fortis]